MSFIEMNLFTPLSYIHIRHPLKRRVDRAFPIIAAILAATMVTVIPKFNLFGPTGLTYNINGLFQILPGFFITSLAAIATFNGEAYKIDEVFDGEKAILYGEALTRRRFLCHLFSYLSLISLSLYLFGAFSLAASANLHDATSENVRLALRAIFAAVSAGGLAHTLGTTLIGLIFLSGRIPGESSVPKYRIAEAPLLPSGVANIPSKPATPGAPTPRS